MTTGATKRYKPGNFPKGMKLSIDPLQFGYEGEGAHCSYSRIPNHIMCVCIRSVVTVGLVAITSSFHCMRALGRQSQEAGFWRRTLKQKIFFVYIPSAKLWLRPELNSDGNRDSLLGSRHLAGRGGPAQCLSAWTLDKKFFIMNAWVGTQWP